MSDRSKRLKRYYSSLQKWESIIDDTTDAWEALRSNDIGEMWGALARLEYYANTCGFCEEHMGEHSKGPICGGCPLATYSDDDGFEVACHKEFDRFGDIYDRLVSSENRGTIPSERNIARMLVAATGMRDAVAVVTEREGQKGARREIDREEDQATTS